MLTTAGKTRQARSLGDLQRNDRNRRRERRLWHDPDHATGSLGCNSCPDRAVCGGLRLKCSLFDCLEFCCRMPNECDRVCRNNPDFANRVREVGTFDFGTVRRAAVLATPAIPCVVPIVYHRAARHLPTASKAIALPLYRMFDRRDGVPRYRSRKALEDAFSFGRNTAVILTGTDRDRPLERWWALGENARIKIIRALKHAGIALVTTPNYSLFIDRPRWDDLHAMKRIAIVHEEFLRVGLPAALHINGRTEVDFRRWTEHVRARPEITHLAYEFTTGTRRAGRLKLHAAWLGELAASVGRPLHLVVRGGAEVIPNLLKAFSGVTLLDASIFMKTMMRQRACLKHETELGWEGIRTRRGAPVDELFTMNCQVVEAWLNNLIASSISERASFMR